MMKLKPVPFDVSARRATIDYRMQDEVGTSVVCLGVLGVNAEILRRARAVNISTAEFPAICTPLQHIESVYPKNWAVDDRYRAIRHVRVNTPLNTPAETVGRRDL